MKKILTLIFIILLIGNISVCESEHDYYYKGKMYEYDSSADWKIYQKNIALKKNDGTALFNEFYKYNKKISEKLRDKDFLYLLDFKRGNGPVGKDYKKINFINGLILFDSNNFEEISYVAKKKEVLKSFYGEASYNDLMEIEDEEKVEKEETKSNSETPNNFINIIFIIIMIPILIFGLAYLLFLVEIILQYLEHAIKTAIEWERSFSKEANEVEIKYCGTILLFWKICLKLQIIILPISIIMDLYTNRKYIIEEMIIGKIFLLLLVIFAYKELIDPYCKSMLVSLIYAIYSAIFFSYTISQFNFNLGEKFTQSTMWVEMTILNTFIIASIVSHYKIKKKMKLKCILDEIDKYV